MPERFDIIVIGAGQAGGPFAGACAKAGRRTALVEAAHVGGTCVNEGCTPTKTMVASARVAHLARRAADYGVRTGEVAVDLEVVRRRKREVVASWREGSEGRLREAGVELIMGEASFSGPRAISVALAGGGARELGAETVVINAGARPAVPQLPGLDRVPFLDSTSVMELGEAPEHLLVLGGGYIGLEFGQMFRRFGSRVTIVQRGPRLLAREDPDIADAVATILREDGVEVLLDSEARRAARGEGGGVVLTVKTPQGERELAGSHLLVAAGRAPNSDRLNLAAAGVETGKGGHIAVDERLATSAPGVYAVGDIKGGPAFTHISYDDFRILQANLLEGGDRTTAGRLVPYTVFIDPQLGRVGLGEEEARAQGRAVKVASMPMARVARAIEVDETRGLMKAVVDAATDRILGCAILGLEGGEIMSALQIAMLGGLPYTALRDGVFAHPTLAESLNNLFASV
ncbi:MAG TPA: mercuric reductase [Chloroflexaceae bacterium]|nr:mercuric reductase [Chloroflexaceae bacterium]